MKKLNIFIIAIVQFLIVGCAGNEFMTKNLSTISSENKIIFNEDQTYLQKRGIGVMWKEGLKRGVYRPELENEAGTFYRGPEGCVIQFMEASSMGPFDGGIWIPKDKINNRPRIYYYFNFNHEKAIKAGGAIVALLLAPSVGDITIMPSAENGTFLDEISITNF
ncbi:hypothetical protein [Methylotenera sp. N17]|uniref:hypothetical protein n=1 Tax=Methylotenera sp. N17 TaxID=1502761 RepID=UPI000646CC80|nr:hypothetical protein [Methylotenera sp. N17]